jgi:hypothetical protein
LVSPGTFSPLVLLSRRFVRLLSRIFPFAIPDARTFLEFLFVLAEVIVVVDIGRRDIVGELGLLNLLLKGLADAAMEVFPGFPVDGMRDIGVESGAAPFVANRPVAAEPPATLTAIAGGQRGLLAAFGASVRQFAAGHGHKQAFRALDNPDISDHDSIVQSNAAEGLELIAAVVHQLDADFGNFHGGTSSSLRCESKAA